ncbi:MAG: M28 family peptidase [Cyanobacteria bacterium P01_H01_bin.119]
MFNLKLLCFGTIAIAPVFVEPAAANSLRYGETAAEETYYLSSELAGRSVGSDQEAATVEYLTNRLIELGYDPILQPFTYNFGGTTLTSYNVIAERQGTSDKHIILGAHYDTDPSSATLDRSALEGTNDNASGVGVLLELAERQVQDPTVTSKFVFFGAEEIGLIGSDFYANSLSEDEIADSLFMLNLDSLIFGDFMYFNAGRGATDNPDWFEYRDLALEIAAENDIDARTNPGLNDFYPAGTGCCSDLESFDFLMPVLAAEATNWSIGELDGFTQTADPRVPNGRTWHDPATDNRAFINEIFPGLIEERTRNYTLVLDKLLVEVNASQAAVPEPTSAIALVLVAGGGLILRRPKKALRTISRRL